jgi:hypothetical protein
MSDSSTPYSNKIEILADLWLNYRDEPEFEDFVEYNDLGLPLSFLLSNAIVKATPAAENFIDETFDLLLAGLNTADTGFETLDDLLALGDIE